MTTPGRPSGRSRPPSDGLQSLVAFAFLAIVLGIALTWMAASYDPDAPVLGMASTTFEGFDVARALRDIERDPLDGGGGRQAPAARGSIGAGTSAAEDPVDGTVV
jgi:hypothetical protein